MSTELVLLIALLVLLLPAAFIDCRQRRIPNWLSLTGWLAGPLLHAALGGWSGAEGALLGLALSLALTFPFFLIGWLGAGDVKLIAAVGGIVGIDHALATLFAIAIVGGLFGLARLVERRMAGATLRRIGVSVGLTLATRRPIYLAPATAQEQAVLPYAIPIAVGTFAAWAYAGLL